jgi:hypothetical protein
MTWTTSCCTGRPRRWAGRKREPSMASRAGSMTSGPVAMGSPGQRHQEPRNPSTAHRGEHLEDEQWEAPPLLLQPFGVHRSGFGEEWQACRALSPDRCNRARTQRRRDARAQPESQRLGVLAPLRHKNSKASNPDLLLKPVDHSMNSRTCQPFTTALAGASSERLPNSVRSFIDEPLQDNQDIQPPASFSIP